MFKADGCFNSVVENLKVGFHPEFTNNFILSEEKPGGIGFFENLMTSTRKTVNNAHESHIRGVFCAQDELK